MDCIELIYQSVGRCMKVEQLELVRRLVEQRPDGLGGGIWSSGIFSRVLSVVGSGFNAVRATVDAVKTMGAVERCCGRSLFVECGSRRTVVR